MGSRIKIKRAYKYIEELEDWLRGLIKVNVDWRYRRSCACSQVARALPLPTHVAALRRWPATPAKAAVEGDPSLTSTPALSLQPSSGRHKRLGRRARLCRR